MAKLLHTQTYTLLNMYARRVQCIQAGSVISSEIYNTQGIARMRTFFFFCWTVFFPQQVANISESFFTSYQFRLETAAATTRRMWTHTFGHNKKRLNDPIMTNT